MDGLSAHDEMARAIRTAIGLLEDEEMARAETRVEAALPVLREVAHLANGPAVDLDAVWTAVLRRGQCHACDEDSRCAAHAAEPRSCKTPGCRAPGVEESATGGYYCAACWRRLLFVTQEM